MSTNHNPRRARSGARSAPATRTTTRRTTAASSGLHEVDAGAVVLSSGRRISAAVDASETVTADGRVTLSPIRANVFDGGNLSDLTQDDLGRLVGFLGLVAAQLRRVETADAAADLVQEVQA